MIDFTLPRYFVGHSNLRDSAEKSFAALPIHVIDSVLIGNRHLADREWIITVDEVGDLRAWSRENREAFSESLQNELAYNEISQQRPSRYIEATEIYLFNLQIVEQIGTTSPGLNDPVYLYGTLYKLGNEGVGIKGQLTVTRGDLLAALIHGADSAFRYHEAVGDGYSRCFQMMLPADTEAEIRRGAGIVLTYPLFPAELLTMSAANEIIVSQMIYDLLGGLKEDLQREKIDCPLTATVLPVPSRFALERELETQGYKIEGDWAVKENAEASGFKGLLASIFGGLKDDELFLPNEGTIEDFLTLARDTLQTFEKDLLTPRVFALRNCLKNTPTNNSPTSAFVPRSQAASQDSMPNIVPLVSSSRRKNKILNSQSTDWVKDFTLMHQTGDSKSKITSTLEMKPHIISAATPKSKQEKQQEWQRDFAVRPPIKSTDEKLNESKDEKKKQSATGKPDWMKDFE